MGALYKCTTNFICFENFINLSFSCGILYYFVQRAKIIYNGNKGVLVPIDIILCVLGTLQMILQVIYFLCAESSIVLITLRCFGLGIQVLICVILISVVIDKGKVSLPWIGRLGLCAVVSLWIYEANIHYKESVYNCSEISNLYMSLFGLILSIVAFSVGFECVHDLHRYREYLLENKNDTYAPQLLKIEIRVTQIRILKISGLIQFSVQFIWDFMAYFLSQTTLECSFFYQPKSLGSVFIYVALKIISLNTLPIAVFLVFYECNKEYFNMDSHIWNHQRSHRHLQMSTEQLIPPNETEMQEVK